MAGAKVINLVDVRLREEMTLRDTVIGELMNEMVTLRELVDALARDIDQLKQGGDPPAQVPVPKKQTPEELSLKSFARAYTERSISALGGIVENGESETARVAAACALLDRGWGKPKQSVEHTGADGNNAIEVTIRTIVEGKK